MGPLGDTLTETPSKRRAITKPTDSTCFIMVYETFRVEIEAVCAANDEGRCGVMVV